MALFKVLIAVLMLVLIPLLAVCGDETGTIQDQDEDVPLEKRIQAQSKTLTSILTLLKQLQRRVHHLESRRIHFLRGRDGRDGLPGIPGKCLTCKDGRDGKNGAPGPRGTTGTTGRAGSNGQRGPPGPEGTRGTKGASGSRGTKGAIGSRGPRGYRGPGGVQYVRWGRTTCPSGVSLVYKGRIGGEHYSHSGGGSNYLCLPENPRYRRYRSGVQGGARMYGTEYHLYYYNPFTRSLHDHDAPCAVCYVTTRSAKMMIPATYACPAGWTREYHGYLMSERHNHAHSSNFICVDQYPQAVPGSRVDRNGALLYPVEGVCGALPCYPYVAGGELTCSVCTK